jgi:phosphoesterase RecJ-like protein
MMGSRNEEHPVAVFGSPEEVAQFLHEGDHFLVVSHVSPDGDAVSSVSAMGYILRAMNKSYTLINEGEIPQKLLFLLGEQPIVHAEKQVPSLTFEWIICLDCASLERIGTVSRWFAPSYQLLNIDHHATNQGYGTHRYVNVHAAATAQVLYDLLTALRMPMTTEMATTLYAGLLTDTGGFRYGNTNARVLEIAHQLVSHGVNAHALAQQLLEKMSPAQMLLLKEAIATLTFGVAQRVAWIVISLAMLKRVVAQDEHTEGLVNFARNVDGVEVGMLFKQKSDLEVKVSFRSAGRINVAHIAQYFGGGGHVLAAGCTVYGSLETVVQDVTAYVETYV